MRTLDTILEMLRGLQKADDRLQALLEGFVRRYFQFIKSSPRGAMYGTRHLRLCLYRDRRRRIRAISCTTRIKAKKVVAGRMVYFTRRLREPFRDAWVYEIAKDWARVNDYRSFNRERVALNSVRSATVTRLRDLRLAFDFGWAARATPQDFDDATAIVQHDPLLTKEDLRPIAGALAYCAALRRHEGEIGTIIDEYRRTFANRIEVGFEPATRVNPNGTMRIYWGFPQRVETVDGPRTFTDYIPGRPTDRWMRQLRIRVAARKEVGTFLKRLLPIEREYARLLRFLARYRRRVGEVLARVERLSASAAPRAGGSLLAATAVPFLTVPSAVTFGGDS